jgi:monoamine oxidase
MELHVSAEYARQTPYRQRIAHGALVFSISIGLTVQMNLMNDTTIAFNGVDALRFHRPVFIGDTIHVRKAVAGKSETRVGGIVTFDTQVLNQRSETVLTYRDEILVRRREADKSVADNKSQVRAVDEAPR